MAQASDIGRFLLVLFFAGSVVVLGAHELQARFRAKYGSGGANRNFFEKLQGDKGSARARLAPQAVQKAENEKSAAAAGGQTAADGSGVGEFVGKLIP